MTETPIKPIFIVGTGRCGSTIFQDIFSYHANLAWLSRFCETHPQRPNRNYLAMRLLDTPLPRAYLRKLIYPVEPYKFWDYYCPGFSRPHRDLIREDVTHPLKKRAQTVLTRMVTEKRHRMLLKITGWPRLSYLHEIFPDAKFIHIYRDGRAVVNSLLNVRWWSGWYGPKNWHWGALTEAQQAKWEQHGESYVALAALEWELLMEAHEQARQQIPAEQYLAVPYEQFCQQPVETFKEVTAFCDLAWGHEFEATIRRFDIKSADYKWQQQLTPQQQYILQDCLADSLARFGYQVS